MKRILAVVMAAIMVLTMAACKDNAANQPQGGNSGAQLGATSINVAYNAADVFNPYTAATSLNRNLSSLIYDPLFKVDSSFNTVNVLAAAYTNTDDACMVMIKPAYFSDGSAVTANDVVYSFNLAKESNEAYKAQLEPVVSAEARDASTVIFKFSKKDQYGVNLLNFPIIKIGSDQLKNEDNVFLPPIGCGRYIINSEQTALLANASWHAGNVNIPLINLINAPDEESLAHSVEIGAIDYYYTDLSDCNIIRMSGNRVNVNLNNLVFLGFNLNSSYFSNAYIRHAISSAINRTQICEEGYYNNALPATGLFHPAWSVSAGAQTIENASNIKIAIENLDEIGYNRKDEEGYCLNSFGNRVEFTLLVNKENSFRVNAANLIASQLRLIGIKINVNAVPYERYVQLLENKSFDLYIAEVNIPQNMDISQLVVGGGSVAYGIPKKSNAKKDAEKPEKSENSEQTDNQDNAPALEGVISMFYEGTGNIPDIAATAISEMPIIPICYRTGVLFCSDKIDVNNSACADDIFFSIENINIK